MKTLIRGLLTSQDTYDILPLDGPRDSSTPLEAILCALMVKAIAGDTKAAEVLLKYSVDRDEHIEQAGFFSQRELRITVVGSKYQPTELIEIDGSTLQR